METMTLPQDVVALQHMLKAQFQQNAALHHQLAELLQQNKHLHEQIDQMQHQLNQLLRHRFGQKSEKQKSENSKKKSSKKSQDNPQSDNDKKQKPRRKRFPDTLERQRVDYEIASDKLHCPDCDTVRQKFGETVSEQLEFVPAKLVVIEHVRYKYACQQCQGHCVEATMPNQPIDKGIPGPKLLTEMLLNKYQDHLPLYRQSQRFKRLGYELSRKTLCGWVYSCAHLLKAIVDYMYKDLLRCVKIHTDDTTIPVQAKDKTHTGRLWVYLSGATKDPPICIYQYSQTRRQKYPLEFFKKYQGYIQADAYPGYDKLYSNGTRIEVACMAHCRRKFDEVASQDNAPARAHTVIKLIAQLYGIEKRCKEMTPLHRYYYRRRYAKVARKKLYYYLKRIQQKVLPKSAFGEAIFYALNHWKALGNYLRNGELSIDNNAAERAIKPVVIGRKNYLFAGSHVGAENAAIIYSIIETCKMNQINTANYMTNILRRLPNCKITQIAQLVPYHWKNKI